MGDPTCHRPAFDSLPYRRPDSDWASKAATNLTSANATTSPAATSPPVASPPAAAAASAAASTPTIPASGALPTWCDDQELPGAISYSRQLERRLGFEHLYQRHLRTLLAYASTVLNLPVPSTFQPDGASWEEVQIIHLWLRHLDVPDPGNVTASVLAQHAASCPQFHAALIDLHSALRANQAELSLRRRAAHEGGAAGRRAIVHGSYGASSLLHAALDGDLPTVHRLLDDNLEHQPKRSRMTNQALKIDMDGMEAAGAIDTILDSSAFDTALNAFSNATANPLLNWHDRTVALMDAADALALSAGREGQVALQRFGEIWAGHVGGERTGAGC